MLGPFGIILSRDFSLAGVFFFIVCSSCDFFSFIKKKSWICFCFLFRTDRRRVCWEEVRGEQADRGNRAEKIRNWRKVRNAAFSWLPNSCNFYCHCLDPGHKAQRVGKGACDNFATNQDLAFKSTGSKKNGGTSYL